MTRFRCTQCDKLVEPPFEPHPMRRFLVAIAEEDKSEYHAKKAEEPYHVVHHSVGSGRRGVIGCRLVRDTCGPIVEEHPSDHVLCIEHLLGETI